MFSRVMIAAAMAMAGAVAAHAAKPVTGLMTEGYTVVSKATVDGFEVDKLSDPTSSMVSVPRVFKGAPGVTLTKGNYKNSATDPFGDFPGLAGISPYFYINNTSVEIPMARTHTAFDILWGTPSAQDTFTMYDTNSNVIGTINGGDLQTAYPSTAHGSMFRIISTKPVAKIVLEENTCCFEFANFHAISKFHPS